jgi:prepilin-type N-terminal cleavage/methylation domain-containing protein
VKPSRQQGFTLLEVVAATVLLAALTVALLPILVEATTVASRTAPTVDHRALGAFADRLLADEESRARIEEGGEARFSWDDDAFRTHAEVVATGREFGEGATRHLWVELRCGDARVLRFVSRRPAQPATGEDEGGR